MRKSLATNMINFLDRIFLRLFVWLATLWFRDIAFTTCPKTDRVLTMIFSSNENTVEKVFGYMQKENLL